MAHPCLHCVSVSPLDRVVPISDDDDDEVALMFEKVQRRKAVGSNIG